MNMYEEAMSKIEENITKETKLINSIKIFGILPLADKIRTIKECDLRYKRDTIPQIIQKDFKSEILRNKAKVSIGVNDFILEYDDYTIKIPLYNSNIISIESNNKYKDLNKFYCYETTYEEHLEHIRNEIIIYSTLIEQCKTFIESPTYKNYKDLMKKLNRKKKNLICFIFCKKAIVSNYNTTLRSQRMAYNECEKEYSELLNYPSKIEHTKNKNNKFLEDINEDIQYFLSNGFEFNYKFIEIGY